MRLILTILFFGVYAANATNYYVANTGDDSHAGTSIGTAWKTAAKVNSSTFSAGDSIFFNRGDIWNEQLKFPSSGASGNVIYIGAYGTGNKPLITGFNQVPNASWVDSASHFWKATLTNNVSALNCVTMNDTIRAKGRYPNYGQMVNPYIGAGLLVGRGTTNNSFYSTTHLSDNYAGAQLAIRQFSFVTDVSTILSQTVDTFSFSPITYTTTADKDFIIENSVKVMDTIGEWTINGNDLYMYANDTPNIKTSTIDTLAIFHRVNYIKIGNISFSGANKSAISLDTLSSVTIENCTFNNIGWNAIVCNVATNRVIQNDSILNCQNDAIFDSHLGGDTLTIQDNYIKNCGIWYGMGGNSNDQYLGIFTSGNYATIQRNRIDSVGFNGISVFGAYVNIYRNWITSACLTKSDGAGIYLSAGLTQTGTFVRSNIIQNTIGYNSNQAASGIYLDGNSQFVNVDSNTIENANIEPLFLHFGRNDTITNNTVVGSASNCLFVSAGFAYENIQITHNIFYQKNKLYPTINAGLAGQDTSVKEDYNYVLRPDSVDNQFNVQNTPDFFSLSGWQAYTGLDLHSSLAPSSIISVGTLYINPTLSDSTIYFSGWKVDAKGTGHRNSVTIKPYGSILLFDVAQSPLKYLLYYKL